MFLQGRKGVSKPTGGVDTMTGTPGKKTTEDILVRGLVTIDFLCYNCSRHSLFWSPKDFRKYFEKAEIDQISKIPDWEIASV